MHSITFLQDLAVVMLAAGMMTVLFHRIKQPVVLGYIVAGMIIGPHTPPFPLIHDQETIDTLSQLGVVMLMFSLGLEFSLRKLKQVGVTAFIAAFLEILLMAWLGYETGRFFGWSTMDSLFLGGILSISSTTIIVKALAELGKSKESFASLIFGILIIEDILGIAMIALLSSIVATGNMSLGVVGITLGKLTVFLVVVLVAGLIAVPRLLSYVARFKSNEMLLVTVLGLCFGVSLLAVKFGYSVALGAFLIGAVIAEAREIHKIEELVEPVKDMFSAVFFVAIGLLIDPKMIVQHWLPIVVITLVVIIGKVLACSFGTFLGGNSSRTSLRVGMGLAQIGEFSFIIASLGITLKVTSEFLYPIAVAVSVLTTLSTPYLIKQSDRLVALFDKVAPKWLLGFLELYTQWVGRLGNRPNKSLAAKLIRRWTLQMALNATLIAGVFIAAVFVGQRPPEWLQKLQFKRETLDACLWLTAVICSLPMLIATSRKLQALGLLIAETRSTTGMSDEAAAAIRAFISQAVSIGGTVVLGLYVLVLSSTLLPPMRVLIVLLFLIGILAWLLWRSFIRIYAKAQIALEETFAEAKTDHKSTAALLPTVLPEANLETVTIELDCIGVGRLIRELNLRMQSGASIVGIDRDGKRIINPGADEEIRVGDQLLLLGTDDQLSAAKNVLSKKANSPS